ncbi:unnamed protein product, partial [Orchesella dallaii]
MKLLLETFDQEPHSLLYPELTRVVFDDVEQSFILLGGMLRCDGRVRGLLRKIQLINETEYLESIFNTTDSSRVFNQLMMDVKPIPGLGNYLWELITRLIPPQTNKELIDRDETYWKQIYDLVDEYFSQWERNAYHKRLEKCDE